MSNFLCKGGKKRDQWAVSLCFSSALIMSLEALHGKECLAMGLTAGQTYALYVSIATLSVFLGTFILTRLISRE